jgi:hypothetical protein
MKGGCIYNFKIPGNKTGDFKITSAIAPLVKDQTGKK